ncbi:MAG: glycoside hydrolase family 2 TIM barrel-domain containing protein [Opitutales bacterium]
MKTLRLFFTLIASAVPAFAAEFIWLESESLPNPPEPASATSWARPERISGGQMLAVNVGAREIEAKIPEAGVVLVHEFQAVKAGSYTIWNRLLFTSARSPFEWRLNGGEWQTNSQETHPLSNVQELSFWNPIGWTRMGAAEVQTGSNKLEIRLMRQTSENNRGQQQMEALRYVSDALCLHSGDWVPNFKHKPDWQPNDSASQKAATQVFKAPASEDPRLELSLAGHWQYGAWDEWGEITEATRTAGVDALPDYSSLAWYGIRVPSNRNNALPEFLYNHRGIYKTRIDVPASYEGRRTFLHFESLNLIATLFVNGAKVGDFDVVYGQWRPEITAHLKPGQVNEVALVIKDAFYALSPAQDGGTVRRDQYFPMEMFQQNQGVTMRFDYPVKAANRTGILDTVQLIATGPVTIDDVFVKPFPITRGELEIDTRVSGKGSGTRVHHRIEPWSERSSGEAETSSSTYKHGESFTDTQTVASKPFDLWHTYDPHLYNLITEVSVDGKVVDRKVTRFGVREWEYRGNQFFLNGVRQHLRADLTYYGAGSNQDLEQVIETWQNNGNNMFRLRFQWPWAGKSPTEALEWMDEVGMPVRKNAGTFDGQHASYRLALGRGDQKKSNDILFENWQAQMLNRVQADRNHPSVFIWELDNEIVYINGRNFGNLDVAEPPFTETSNAIMALDPTRGTITGGGNALMDESLPTYGPHYFEMNDREYPDEAYTLEKSIARQGTGKGGKVWPLTWDSRPTLLSETAFLPGRDPASFAQVGGEVAFLGKSEGRPAIGRIATWLAAGYRWAEMAGTHFWFAEAFTDGSYTMAWQPIAVLCRNWNWTWGSGQAVRRDFKIFNDTRDTSPITVRLEWILAGQTVASNEQVFEIEAGEDDTWSYDFAAPQVSERRSGTFHISAEQNGAEVFRHSEETHVIPMQGAPLNNVSGNVVVWDPHGEAAQRLGQRGVRFQTADAMQGIPADFDLLIVGRDAVSPRESTDPQWLRWAAAGKKILVLEQANPLHFQAIPANAEPSDYTGRIAFSQNLEHPVFTGLIQEDLFCWNGDHVVYKNVYTKPTKGGLSLAHCDDKLGYSAVIFSPVNEGGLLLSQLVVAQKLTTEPAAATLFDNMVAYMADYAPVERETVVVASDGTPASKLFADMGLSYTATEDTLAALKNPAKEIVVVEATPERLKTLADNQAMVDAFNQRGGWLMILELTPDGLPHFNRLVGYDHLMRPFRTERVQFPAVRDPLTAGLSLRDVVMTSGERIQRHSRDEWPASDAFEYIVDLDDIAPFSEFPSPAYWNDPGTTGPRTDTWPLNMVNGFLADAHWRLIFSIHLNKDDPTSWTIDFPRVETVTGLAIAPNAIYHRVTDIALTFDDDPESKQVFALDPNSQKIEVEVDPVQTRRMTIELTDWDESGRSDVIGVDNLWVRVQRPDDFAQRVRPMLNIGGLVKYPRGNGGLLLNQYKIAESEANPVNAAKKKTVTAMLLRNLGAVFAGGETIVAGQNLRYGPISLENYCNLYLTQENGWPVREHDLSALPIGDQTFAGVRYAIRDFKTSPLENAVSLQAQRLNSRVETKSVEGMRIGTSADALFFLHTFMQTREWNPRNPNAAPPTVFEYQVNYADGYSEVIAVDLGIGVTDWLIDEPKGLRDAAVAWTAKPAPSAEQNAIVYQMQWTNPRPDKVIASVDLRYGEAGDRYGAPVLLGITAARQVR